MATGSDVTNRKPAPPLDFERGALDDGLKIDTQVRVRADGSRTTVHVRQTYSFESAATMGAALGWKSSLDQLEALARR